MESNPKESFIVNWAYSYSFLFNYKPRDITNKQSQFTIAVWTRLTRVGCFEWWALSQLTIMNIIGYAHHIMFWDRQGVDWEVGDWQGEISGINVELS